MLIVDIDTKCVTKKEGISQFNVVCKEDDPLDLLVKRLPPRTIDVVINEGSGVVFGKLGESYVLHVPKNGNKMGIIEFALNKKLELDNRKTRAYLWQ